MASRHLLLLVTVCVGTFGIQFALYDEALRAGVPTGVPSAIAQTGVAIGVFGAFFGAAGLIAIRRAPGISTGMMGRYGISRGVPFSLPVPIFGVTAAIVQLLPNLFPRLRPTPPPLPVHASPAPAKPR